MENTTINPAEKVLATASRIISAISAPFFIPFVAFIALFLFTYLRVMPNGYKLIVLGIVASFTIFLPVVMIFLFLKMNGAPVSTLQSKSKRYVPYILTIVSFTFCSLMMYRLSIPWFMNGIILSSILIMIVFLLVNLKWKISSHAGGMGAIIGGIISFPDVFQYDPLWLLCLFIIISGLVGSARIILGKHTLNEVIAGFTIGLLCTITILHPTGNILFRMLLF